VKEVSEEEEKEETEESRSKEAMDLEKTQDDAHDGASLASIFAKDGTSSLAKASQASTVTDPPCHQSTIDSEQEESNMEGEDEQDEQEETETLMPSVSDVVMKEYQMKLSVPKKNEEDYLYLVIKRMMLNDWGMGIHPYDPSSAHAHPEIASFDNIPDTDEGREHYFRPIHDKRNKKGTSLVFRISTEYSHVEWRKYMETETQESQLYVGIHKLESTETEIIGFIAQKHPEMTHLNRFETALMMKLPKETPKLVIECIFPKTTGGFERPVKTDVLAIRVCKTDTKAVDKALARLLPPKPEGEYYVSYSGLDDELKRKVYKHQNWYKKTVEIVPVSGFNNIDRQHDIGMNKTWSFREFMCEQPSSSTTVPIDVDNGGFKVKGTKILVLPKFKKDAQRTYEEFRKLTKRNKNDDFDAEMHDDDATVAYSNHYGNDDQLQAMFDHEQFPDLTETIKSDASQDNANAGGSKARTSRRKAKQPKSSKSLRQEKKRARESPTRPSATVARGTSPSRSYSSVVGGATATGSVGTRGSKEHGEQTELQEMKEMMERLLTLSTQAQMESAVYRREATASANMVQRLVTNNRALSDQVSLLHSALETLSRASSCDSTLTSVADTLEKARQLREANPPPIPAEVFTNDAQRSSDGQQATTTDNGAGGALAEASVLSTTATAEVTPDKPDEEEKVEEAKTSVPSTPPRNAGSQAQVSNDGFVTPGRKHTADANTTPVTQAEIETRNSYSALALESLRSTRNRATTSPSKSPSKKKSKRNLTESFKEQVDARLSLFKEEEERKRQIHLEEELERQARQEQEANHLAGLAGLGTEEDAQFDDVMQQDDEHESKNVTEAENLWQNAFEESDFDMKK
jgi:hypothetical protein